MKKEDGILVLENKDDETMLFDMCDSYLTWLNEDDDDIADEFHEDCKRLRNNIAAEVGHFKDSQMEDILNAFDHREEFFIELWPKILECFKLADLVKVVY